MHYALDILQQGFDTDRHVQKAKHETQGCLANDNAFWTCVQDTTQALCLW